MPDRFIIIHGHFYQPPRENPWLEAVETQDSAFPYHDWNERITAECYEPNATARILDEEDRIRRIVNNYASISFNFGPTLLSWMKDKAPGAYASILAADRESSDRFSGYGNAIAQAYNHLILPLANQRDQRTQVRWGIRDFESHFGRKPLGMWLPETAVDIPSLEALAAEDILFTILEPHQAARWRRIVSDGTFGEWESRPGGWLDPTRPYLCNLPSGRRIAIFFYDGPISRAVAFEQLLARGEYLANRLAGAFNDVRKHAQLVNIATDGETYGHHHPHGEMALAYALKFIEDQHLAKLTNYAEHLSRYPPEHEVEIVERTAWSCSHGVGRWMTDCGCSGGGGTGWNQQWRGPLRSSLDWLRDEVAAIFEREGAKSLRDPWAARDHYIDVLLDRSDETVEAFLTTHRTADSAPRSQEILELLEMQRNSMLMFTSCGWFFSDISGIETVQVLNYAARVIQLAEKVAGANLEPGFLERIGTAHSNLAERGTARQIWDREIIPARLDLSRVAGHYAVLSLFDNFDDEARVYCYSVTRRDLQFHKAGRARMSIGSIEVRSLITHETSAFEFAVLHLGETDITGGVRPAGTGLDYETVRMALGDALQPGGIPDVIRFLDQHFGAQSITLRSIFRDEQRRVLNELLNTTLEEAETTFRQLHERYDPLMRYHARLGIPLPKVLRMAAEFDINVQIRRLLREDPLPLPELESRLREAQDEKVTPDETTLLAFQQAVELASERFVARPEDLDRLEALDALVTIVREADLTVDLRAAQNRYYRMLHAPRPEVEGNGQARERWTELFEGLAAKLSIAPDAAAVRV